MTACAIKDFPCPFDLTRVKHFSGESGGPDKGVILRANEQPTSEGGDYDGPEQNRRRSARFICRGEAKISRLPSDGVFLPGKILDLSLQGCRVDTPVPIGQGVRAEIVVRVNATSFRAVGEVKAVRDGCAAGIEFVQLSATGKEVLSDLVKELARLHAAMDNLLTRRQTNPEYFRAELEHKRRQAGKLTRQFAALSAALVSTPDTDPEEAQRGEEARKDADVASADPVIIGVDLII